MNNPSTTGPLFAPTSRGGEGGEDAPRSVRERRGELLSLTARKVGTVVRDAPSVGSRETTTRRRRSVRDDGGRREGKIIPSRIKLLGNMGTRKTQKNSKEIESDERTNGRISD